MINKVVLTSPGRPRKRSQMRNPFEIGKFRRFDQGRKQGGGTLKRKDNKLSQKEAIILDTNEKAVRIMEIAQKLGIQLTKNKDGVIEIVKDQLKKSNI